MPVKVALRKTSFVDYPGCISSVLFFPACNLRCPWCHNRELVLGEDPDSKRAEDLVEIEEALAHLRKRRSVLGGAVLSGGEPCVWEGLPELIGEIRKIARPDDDAAFPVKLDTNGTNPAMLEKLLAREETKPDYIALDLKIAPRRYAELSAGGKNSTSSGLAEALIKSAKLIRESGITHEYRTLALPGAFITEKDIEELAPLTDDSPWYIRAFRGGNCLDPAWNGMEETEAVAKALSESLVKKAQELGKTNCRYY